MSWASILFFALDFKCIMCRLPILYWAVTLLVPIQETIQEMLGQALQESSEMVESLDDLLDLHFTKHFVSPWN